MIENHAFFAVFTVQILVMSVLQPILLSRFVRAKATLFPAERFAQLYPGVDRNLATEHYLTLYRAANTVVAVLGFLLLAWLYGSVRSSKWDDMAAFYFMLQALPLCLLGLIAIRYHKVLRQSLLEGKRTANLQRRGLFDFVSPLVVLLAVLGYFLFVAFVIYIQQNPFPGFAGAPISIGGITLVYASQAFMVYMMLYGRKSPFETHANRMHAIGLTVKAGMYTCIVCVVFLSLNFALVLLELRSWKPFATSLFFVITAFLCFMGFVAPPRRPEADELGSSPVV